MSFFRLILRLLAVFTVTAGMSAAYAAPELEATGTRIPTRDSLAAVATAHGCALWRETEEGILYEGACFGFPGEVSASFAFNGRGEAVKSEIVLADTDYAERLRKGMELIVGRQIASSHGEACLIGGELWSFVPDVRGVRFVREVFTDEAKEVREFERAVSVLGLF